MADNFLDEMAGTKTSGDNFLDDMAGTAPKMDSTSPKDESWLTRVGGDLGERVKKVTSGELYSPYVGQTAYNLGGQVAGAANDIIGQTAKSLYKTVVPDRAQEAISETAKDIFSKPYIAEPIKAAWEYYDQFKKENPNAANFAEATGNYLSFVPLTKGTAATVSGAGKVVSTASKPISRVVKEAVGAYTGRGPGFIEEMVKGSEAAEKAMRGKISGEEIVQHAKNALQKIRDTRHAEYLNKLDNVRSNPKDLANILDGLKTKLDNLSKPNEYDLGISMGKDGVPIVDFSKSTIVEHQNVVKKAIQDILTWDDTTARGLDNLSKRLGTYVKQSGRGTPAESLITQLKNDVKTGLKRTVPEYEAMTKGYYEATSLIKDIESNLMLRPQNMTGRITADNTLRRLSSALKEGKEMRKDLLRTLGTKSGMEIPQEVAGYLATQWLPAGILGKGLTLGSAFALHFLNPQWWPVVAASSPRVVGEFLNAFGKARNLIKNNVKIPSRPPLKIHEVGVGIPAYMAVTSAEKRDRKKTLRDFNRVLQSNELDEQQ